MSQTRTLISHLHKIGNIKHLNEELSQLIKQVDKTENFAFEASRILRRVSDYLTSDLSMAKAVEYIKQGIRELEAHGPVANTIIQRLVSLIQRVSATGSLQLQAFPSDKILLVDFDDTIAEYQGPPPALPGQPMEGVTAALSTLHNLGWKIHIFSGRTNHEEGTVQIAEWMDRHNLPYDSIIVGKPSYTVIVDDSALQFTNSWEGLLDQINQHKNVAKSGEFYPSLVQAPNNIGNDSESDVVIPSRPYWADAEENWHFPYKDRNIDWDYILPYIVTPKQIQARQLSAIRSSEGFKEWLKSDPRFYNLRTQLKFPVEALDNLTVEFLSKNQKKSKDFENFQRSKLNVPEQVLYLDAEMTDEEAASEALVLLTKYIVWLTETGILDKQAQKSLQARQPNTLWRIDEPFSPLPVTFTWNRDDDLLWQQYSRQYMALRQSPYWSNMREVLHFLLQSGTEAEKSGLLYKVLDKGANFLLGKVLITKR